MTATDTAGAADREAVPELRGDYTADAAATAAFLASVEDRVDTEGGTDRPPTHDPLRVAARLARRRFVERHADRLHTELTDGRRAFPRLDDLAAAAAREVPGLAPTKEQLEAERQRPQREKVGREIDHGILFWGLLRSPLAGRHLMEAMRRPTPRALAALSGFRATGRADLTTVTVERRGGIGEVTVNNAAFLNAEDDLLVGALETAVDLVLLDDSIRVGVMRGAPMTHPRYTGRRVFSAGINLTRLYQGQISLIDFFLTRELGYIHKIQRGLSVPDDGRDWWPEPVEKPWIAAVDTFAIGGGAQICLVFDRVIATDEAYFTLPALREGIIPGAANLRLPRVAGGRLSRQAIYADRRIDAASPEGRLLCDETVPHTGMASAIEAAADGLAAPAVINNRRVLHAHEEPEEELRRYLARYAVEQSRRLHSPDLVENLERTWISRSR
ncbi:enoyl-CoA hydratase/isomerase family protein [Streptomyces sp. OF3]|uniref:Enoyl-CoA hydratase/isomerase family protein n=1 Tax=Streptomyces alkaliterrae TaxID=2213162 RepID=A0A7W3WIR7_9ACTN|nr:enoyl-CoA hydratase/isomerase family protein [Streptomyces alkaliterrae]MBB1253073.1 enoyl-CoA hydratase/isomerase family protein [Streptomyces alkaliterrae]